MSLCCYVRFFLLCEGEESCAFDISIRDSTANRISCLFDDADQERPVSRLAANIFRSLSLSLSLSRNFLPISDTPMIRETRSSLLASSGDISDTSSCPKVRPRECRRTRVFSDSVSVFNVQSFSFRFSHARPYVRAYARFVSVLLESDRHRRLSTL